MILPYPVDLNFLSQVIIIFDHMKQIIPLKINVGYFLQVFTIFLQNY